MGRRERVECNSIGQLASMVVALALVLAVSKTLALVGGVIVLIVARGLAMLLSDDR
jgi:hypothetical protein